jgi:hypothetical protein
VQATELARLRAVAARRSLAPSESGD